ncbi:hypothetical protein ACJMK2_036738 [Sinanodonta woodiana]|uniref:Uncharacterized protein n=1 Tax=Sinanodonta woodiana TaxID=1069815 RepID=A0ABD3WLP2_SINWO
MALVLRLAWRSECVTNITNCNSEFVEKPKNLSSQGRLSDLKWECLSNSCAFSRSVDSMVFTSINELLEDQWEMAEGSFTHVISGTAEDPIRFALRNKTDDTGLGTFYMHAAIRNDTNRPNISPNVNVFPMERVPFGRETVLNIFTFDGDGDHVRCRWLDDTKMLSGFLLDEERCVLHINPSMSKGIQPEGLYRVSLVAEDFADHPVLWSSRVSRGPFSNATFIFSVRIGPSISGNNTGEGPKFFNHGTLPDGRVASYMKFTNSRVQAPFMVNGTGQRIVTTGPRGMVFDHEETNNVTKTTGTFNPSSLNLGIHIICGASYTPAGLPGDRRCAVFLVGDEDECSVGNPTCAKPYCLNLWKWYTCIDSAKLLSCPISPAVQSTDNIGLKVGLPLGFSLLILILIAIGMYFRDRLIKYFKRPLINPEPDPVDLLQNNEEQQQKQEQSKATGKTTTINAEHEKTPLDQRDV